MADTMMSSSMRTSTDSEQTHRQERNTDIYAAANRDPRTGLPLGKKGRAGEKLFMLPAVRTIDEKIPAIRRTLRRLNIGPDLTPELQQQDELAHHKSTEEHHALGSSEEEYRKQPQRQLTGPVPSSKLNRSLGSPRIFVHDRDLYFLTPQEREVYDVLKKTGRVACYKGLARASPSAKLTNVILVHENDVEPLRRIQALARKMPEEDRHKMATTLECLLDQKYCYTLQLLLFEEDIRITSSSVGTGVESPGHMKSSVRKNWRRPTSYDIIGAGLTGIRDSWIQICRPGNPEETMKIPHQESPSRQKLTKKNFSSRPFTIVEEHGGPRQSGNPPRLRGLRGGADDSELPGSRSINMYGRFILDLDVEKLGSEERVPKVLWWLAGGRVSCKKQAPTAGEMRKRRKAEIENRKEVGFLGTLCGVRVKSSRMSKAQETEAQSKAVSNDNGGTNEGRGVEAESEAVGDANGEAA